MSLLDFPAGTVDKNPPASAGDVGSVPGPGGLHVLWRNEALETQLRSTRAAPPEAGVPTACAP